MAAIIGADAIQDGNRGEQVLVLGVVEARGDIMEQTERTIGQPCAAVKSSKFDISTHTLRLREQSLLAEIEREIDLTGGAVSGFKQPSSSKVTRLLVESLAERRNDLVGPVLLKQDADPLFKQSWIARPVTSPPCSVIRAIAG